MNRPETFHHTYDEARTAAYANQRTAIGVVVEMPCDGNSPRPYAVFTNRGSVRRYFASLTK